MSDIEQIEVSIDECKQIIKDKDSALKLESNRDFKRLIMDGYLKEEAARLTSIVGDERYKEQRDEIIDGLKAISHFRQFMSNKVRMGLIAERDLAEQEIELEEARLHELEGDEA